MIYATSSPRYQSFMSKASQDSRRRCGAHGGIDGRAGEAGTVAHAGADGVAWRGRARSEQRRNKHDDQAMRRQQNRITQDNPKPLMYGHTAWAPTLVPHS